MISSSKRAADAQDEFTFARDEVKKGKPITLAELQKAAKDEIKARYSHQWDWARFCSMVEGNIRVLHGATIAEVRAKHLKDSLDLSFMENEAADIALLQTALANTYAEGK